MPRATSRAAKKLGLLLSIVTITGLQLTGRAQAQENAPTEPDVSRAVTPNVGAPDNPAAIKIVPPKVHPYPPLMTPPGALAEGITSGHVEVELVVDASGHAVSPKIKVPAGHGFDEAALAAAAALVFDPATRNGQPIAARIVYALDFLAPEPEPEPEPPAPAPSQLAGRIFEGGNNVPLAGVEVILSNADPEQTKRLLTVEDGRFSFGDLPAGVYRVRISKNEWATQELEETLTAGEGTDVVYRMTEVEDREGFHATARVAPPPREVTRRTITKEELTRIPGTRGDALRTVELLPGVARPPFGSGVIIVRGSAPNDTQVLLEGIPVPLLYHFGALTSFINSRLLESVDFYPGNFSVRYGRRRGGIVEASLSDPARDKIHGVADFNLIDGSVLLQGPITKNWEFAVAARRSWLDVTLGAVIKQIDDVGAVAAPVYYDYQAMTTYHPSDRDKFRLFLYGSSDNFRLLLKQPSDADSSVSGNFKLATMFHRIQFSWAHKVSDRVDHDLEVAVGVFDSQFGLGNAFDFSLKGYDVYLRSEWRMRVTDRVRLIAGLDAAILPAEVTYGGPPLGQSEGDPNAMGGTAFSNRTRFTANDKFVLAQPAVYLESDIDLHPLHVVLGSRVDYDSGTRAAAFDPRISAHVALTPTTRLKGGIGLFSQPPQYQESSVVFGNRGLRMTRTMHAGGGVDQEIIPGVKVGVEGFYKFLYDRVISTQFGEDPRFVNGGKGRVYGMEVSAKVEPRGRFFGYLSYTLSRSERKDRNEGYHLFDYDQPHILTVSSVYRLGRGWEAGLTFRLVAGSPSTPVIGGVYNKDTGLYSPVYGPLNSIRNPYFHRLDVRVEKLWTFKAWKFAVYLDVQNAYNSSNPEGITYDYEFRQSVRVSGLPILPSLGMRGEL